MSICAQHCSNSTKKDYRRVVRVFRYLNGTKHLGIKFSLNNDINLIAYVDASYNSYSDGKGHYGLTFFIW